VNLAMRGPCCTTGYGNVYRTLVSHLSPRVNVQAFALNNHVAPGCSVALCDRQTFRDLGLLVGYPTDIHQLCTQHRLLYTMAEVSDIPDDWKRELRYSTEVWVPTTFCSEVFRCYHQRVKTIPVGYDETLYHPEDRPDGWREAFWQEVCPEAVGRKVFGSAGIMSPRKGIDVLLRAWVAADLTDAVLVVKSRETPLPIPAVPNVCVIEDDWPAERMADYYRALDWFVLPSRGEGLGLQPIEAAACGTPSLVTRATGPADYIDDQGIYGIEVAGTSRVEGMSARWAEWVEPDLADLVDKLRGLCYCCQGVNHNYRRWSMEALTDRWVAELEQAGRRARG